MASTVAWRLVGAATGIDMGWLNWMLGGEGDGETIPGVDSVNG